MFHKFLSTKSWHVRRRDNQKKVWIAEQKAELDSKKERDRIRELQREKDRLELLALQARTDKEAKTLHLQAPVSFLYQPPPGLEACSASNVKPDSCPALEDDEEEETTKTKHEEMVEKFPLLKNAPTAGDYAKNVQLHHKPFGVLLRNVKCLRCGQWGHQSMDRECPLKDVNPNDDQRKRWEDPFEKYGDTKFEVKAAPCIYGGPSTNPNHHVPTGASEEEEETTEEAELLSKLTTVERALVLEELEKDDKRKRLKRKQKSRHRSTSKKHRK